MKSNFKIIFIAYGLHYAGGTERVTINMINWLASKNYNVSLISLIGNKKEEFYQIDEHVKLLRYDILGKDWNFIKKIFNTPRSLNAIREKIVKQNPDIIICFGEKLNILISLALLNTNIPLILSENFTPGYYKISLFWEIARELTYRRAKYITVLTPDATNHFSKGIQKKTIAIPNMIISPGIQKDQTKENKKVIAIGRLEYVKGFDILIDAFRLVNQNHSEWKLNIWGDGSLKLDLQKQIKRLKMENIIFLRGVTNNIYQELINSDIFVLSSRLEPFGMVLVESMAVGVPVISTNCPSGPQNIIRNGIDGILVENNNHIKLSESINNLISDKELRLNMGKNALDVIDRFSPEKIMQEWLKLFF